MEFGELRLALLPVAVERDVAEGVVVERVFGLELRRERTGESSEGESGRAGGEEVARQRGRGQGEGVGGVGGAAVPRRLDWRG